MPAVTSNVRILSDLGRIYCGVREDGAIVPEFLLRSPTTGLKFGNNLARPLTYLARIPYA